MQETEAQRGKTQKTGKEFTELFSRELGANGHGTEALNASSQAEVTATPRSLQNPALKELQESLASATEDLPYDAVALNQAAEQMENMLGSLEDYAAQLAREEKADLRQAYSLLEGVNNRIHDFKSKYTELGEQHPGLASLFNELDVLTTAETFKFNRGDYI